MDSVTTFIQQQLSRLSDYKTSTKGDSIMICCPYHRNSAGQIEKTPSFSINLFNSKYSPGTFHCFACGESGNWNKLAKKLNLKELNSKEVERSKLLNPLVTELLNSDLLFGKSEVIDYTKDLPWDSSKPWRGISGALVSKVGGKFTLNSKTNDLQLYLPAHVLGKTIGGISCLLKKEKGKISYINDAGAWVKKVLYPYDYVMSLGKSYVVLVEGPRDALKLIDNNIPALAILGSNSWGSGTFSLLKILNLKKVILGFDNDNVGRLVTKRVYNDLKPYYPLVKLSYPEGVKDPCDLSLSQLSKLKSMINRSVSK